MSFCMNGRMIMNGLAKDKPDSFKTVKSFIVEFSPPEALAVHVVPVFLYT
jgi:hypothetical protein